jgi:flagellar protein FlbD
VIYLTRIDGSGFYLNADLIQTMEETPDTHLLLTNGQSYVAQESAQEITALIVAAKRRVFAGV